MSYLVGSFKRSLDCTGVGAYHIHRYRNIKARLGSSFHGTCLGVLSL